MKQMDREWLETDGLGGFASGTVSGRRTRRYHALLLTAQPEDNSRYVLVNGMEVHVQNATGLTALSSQRYLPNVIHPHGDRLICGFQVGPWPTWDFQLDGETRIRQEIFVPRDISAVVLKWSLTSPVNGPCSLSFRPLISGRNYHALHYTNDTFQFDHTGDGRCLTWSPYQGVPSIIAGSNGIYTREPLWYRHFYYTAEEERGLDCSEDLASPGTFRFDLNLGPAVCILTTSGPNGLKLSRETSVTELVEQLQRDERARRLQFGSRLHRSADQYITRSGLRRTIIAGYPWFTDWGRDTFISLRGLCLTTERFDDAEQILLSWSKTISEGMLPNRFPDGKSEPEYNSVDSALWYIIAIDDFLKASKARKYLVSDQTRTQLRAATEEILRRYLQGTRYKIQADVDGLLQAGEPGVQLTWMDAKVNDWVVTPRIGKPVEVQALWINALWIASQYDSQWNGPFSMALASFRKRFWNPEANCLFDVVDVDHIPETADKSIRPNQILAVGGLPLCLLKKDQAKKVVDTVEEQLLTPLGLRTLSPDSPNYHPHYTGGVMERDGAYHQGTAWAWLMGPFVEAWLRTNGESELSRSIARAKFIQPLLDHLEEAGIGHLSEIADGDPTNTPDGPKQIPRGCPFQAWSLAELIRVLEGPLANGLHLPGLVLPEMESYLSTD